MVTTACAPESDCDMWRRQYAEALAAQHTLIMGGAVASISSGDGKQVTYSQTKRGDLAGWIWFLKGKVDRCNGLPCGANGRARILTPDF